MRQFGAMESEEWKWKPLNGAMKNVGVFIRSGSKCRQHIYPGATIFLCTENKCFKLNLK